MSTEKINLIVFSTVLFLFSQFIYAQKATLEKNCSKKNLVALSFNEDAKDGSEDYWVSLKEGCFDVSTSILTGKLQVTRKHTSTVHRNFKQLLKKGHLIHQDKIEKPSLNRYALIKTYKENINVRHQLKIFFDIDIDHESAEYLHAHVQIIKSKKFPRLSKIVYDEVFSK